MSGDVDVQPKIRNDPTAREDSLKKIYSWATKNTSEARQLQEFRYHWPDPAKRLRQFLELADGSLVALVGLSGVGKSSAQVQVARALNEKFSKDGTGRKVVSFKWPGYLDQNYARIFEILDTQGVSASNQQVIRIISESLATSRNSRVMRRRLREVFGERLSEEDLTLKDALQKSEIESLLEKGITKEPQIRAIDVARNLLGPSDLVSLNKELVISLLSQCHTIMIDLRDYGYRDSRVMNTDLFEIQKLWQLVNEHLLEKTRKNSPPNLVFTLQKELTISDDQTTANYFLRKAAMTIELLPLNPKEMAQVYLDEFGDYYPFDLNALELLGRYSRGVFRRFLKYVQLCLDWKISQKDELTITKDVVEKAITPEEMRHDWELEMRQIFPRGDNWSYAFKVLNILALANEHTVCLTEKQLGDMVEFVSRSDLWRILVKLEERGYLVRRKSERGMLLSVNW